MSLITDNMYQKTTDRDWRGKRVRLLRDIETGAAIYAAGATAVITRKFQGFELLSDPCSCCNVRLRIKRVSPTWIELIDGVPVPSDQTVAVVK